MRILALILFMLITKGSASGAGMTCQSLPIMLHVYLRNHLTLKAVTPEIRQRTAEQLIKAMDPSQVSLLKPEVDGIQKLIVSVFDSSMAADCSPLKQVQDIMVLKSEAALAFATSVLDEKYVLDKNTELKADPKERGYPESEEARQELQLKLIHFQIASYLLGGMELAEAKKQLLHRYELGAKRTRERKDSEILDLFVSSFAQALDPHSSYLSPSRMQDFQIAMHLSLEGIGAQLTWKDGYTIIDEIIPGGAADRVGLLRPRDKILAVAQDKDAFVNVMDMDLPDVVQLIRGKKGTRVRLSILRQGAESERLEVSIVRDKIDIKDSAAKLEIKTWPVDDGEYKFGILELPSFYGDPQGVRSSYKDVRNLLMEAETAKVDGLVLNLSRNGGGLLEDAVRISGLFMHKGAVVATQSAAGIDVLEDKDPAIQYRGPLVVLTSRRSASASEILAGAIKDYRRGIIVGDSHTFGKGTVQMFTPISEELGGITVTTGMFFRPSGRSTQAQGVEADLILPSIWDRDDFGEKSMDYVLPTTSILQFRSYQANLVDSQRGFNPVSQTQLTELSKLSQARTTSSTDFLKILEEVKEIEKNRSVIRVSEMMNKSDETTKKEAEDEKRPRSELIAEYDRPYLEESMQILVDLIKLQTSKTP